MNNRLLELALEADLMRYKSDGINIRIENFANLILQDVMNLFGDELISLHYLEQPCCEDSVLLLQTKIKERFGEYKPNESIVQKIIEVLEDLRGYSGVGTDGNPYDTPSWNAALESAKDIIKQRMINNPK